MRATKALAKPEHSLPDEAISTKDLVSVILVYGRAMRTNRKYDFSFDYTSLQFEISDLHIK